MERHGGAKDDGNRVILSGGRRSERMLSVVNIHVDVVIY